MFDRRSVSSNEGAYEDNLAKSTYFWGNRSEKLKSMKLKDVYQTVEKPIFSHDTALNWYNIGNFARKCGVLC
ncbi:hypothetical protein BSK59_20225 [Paenibacillus odorifer]|nr:hypothetical protein BSK59_20225 [Paenibacillus odorifer]